MKRLVEALIEKFLGQKTVQRAAPSNTAARILGGDTVHALCKLPPASLAGKRGHLSDGVLKKHRQRWKHVRAFLLDVLDAWVILLRFTTPYFVAQRHTWNNKRPLQYTNSTLTRFPFSACPVGGWVTESACRFIYNAGRYCFIRHYWRLVDRWCTFSLLRVINLVTLVRPCF